MVSFSLNISHLTAVALVFFLGSNLSYASPSDVTFDHSRAFHQDFYVQSNLEFTLLHELAHAVIDLNDIPVLGGQSRPLIKSH